MEERERFLRKKIGSDSLFFVVVHFIDNAAGVRLDRVPAHIKLGGDLAAAHALSHELKNLKLTARDSEFLSSGMNGSRPSKELLSR
jgi:hypothetical protein